MVLVCCRSRAAAAQPQGPEDEARFVIDEGSPPIGGVNGYATLGGDSALVVDNSDGLFLIVSDRRTGMIGAKGAGPCEYQDVTAYTVAGDTLFVLDRSLARIVGYAVTDGSCLSEYSDPLLRRFAGVARVGPWFFLTVNSYSTTTAPETALLYGLNAAGDFMPLAPRKADLESDLLTIPIVTRRRRHIMERDGVIYFLLPLTHKLWQYDTRDGSVSFFDLAHDSADISAHSRSQDFAVVRRLIGDIEMELGFFLLEDHIVVGSNLRGKWMRSRYTYAGELTSREEVSGHLTFEENGAFFTVLSQDDERRSLLIEPVDPK